MINAYIPKDKLDRTQPCAICGTAIPFSERYPHYLCALCADRAVDENGRKLAFSNVSMSGGFIAYYPDTKEERDSHICYIDGIECRADEARFGGIVIQIYGEQN
jgi:hypothetical protein